MYILISQDKAITTDGILGIFDLDNTTVSKASREYINYAEKAERVKRCRSICRNPL